MLPEQMVRGFVFLAAFVGGAGAAPAPTEYEIKAVFLYHFTQFVDWPRAAFPADDSPFVVGVVGSEPIAHALERIVRGEMAGSHPLKVQDVSDVMSEFKCQILYFSGDGETLLDPSRLRTAPVLTVGESDSFYKNGGMIQLYIDHRRVRMRVNLEAAREHSLVISAKLLRVAEVSDWTLPRFDTIPMTEEPALEPQGGLVEDGPLEFPRRKPQGVRILDGPCAVDSARLSRDRGSLTRPKPGPSRKCRSTISPSNGNWLDSFFSRP